MSRAAACGALAASVAFATLASCTATKPGAGGDAAPVGPVTHRFLACGGVTRIVEEDGSTSWTYPAATRDGQVLPNGNMLLVLSRSERDPHGSVVELRPDGSEAFRFAGTQDEVNTAERLPNGRTMLVEAGPHPRILEVDAAGTVVAQTPLRCQSQNAHMESRMTRTLPNGNYLVPQLLDRVVREYTPAGEVVWEFRTPDEPKEAWPFTAIRLDDGHTLITCTHANMVLEVDASGAVVWSVTNADLGRPLLNDPCGAQRLPNGNTVICSYAIGEGGTKLVEVDRAKRVVWTFAEQDGPGIHEVHVLGTGAAIVPGRPMR